MNDYDPAPPLFEPCFIRVTTEDRAGNRGSTTVNVGSIVRVREHDGKVIISQVGQSYDVWPLEDKTTIDRMIEEASGRQVVSAY